MTFYLLNVKLTKKPNRNIRATGFFILPNKTLPDDANNVRSNVVSLACMTADQADFE
jgi:hypothetical protein